jgi:hypothetical protein
MGLDMYLSKKTDVRNWSFRNPEEGFSVTVTKGGKPYTNIISDRVSYVVEDVAYWRKFNALHGWIIRECANGIDECQEIDIDEEQFKELLSTLKQVVAEWDSSSNKETIEDLLPPTLGFFFGSTAIDEDYMEDVKFTVPIIEEVLKTIEEDEDEVVSYTYRASW